MEDPTKSDPAQRSFLCWRGCWETLATEPTATVRLYTNCGVGFGTAEHEIVLTVEDGKVDQDRVVVIVPTIC